MFEQKQGRIGMSSQHCRLGLLVNGAALRLVELAPGLLQHAVELRIGVALEISPPFSV